MNAVSAGSTKSAVDSEALWPVRRREAGLRELYATDARSHRDASDAWEAARSAATKRAKGDREAIRAALHALGPAPRAPLLPVLTCPCLPCFNSALPFQVDRQVFPLLQVQSGAERLANAPLELRRVRENDGRLVAAPPLLSSGKPQPAFINP